MPKLDREQILEELRIILHETFEIDPSKIVLQAQLFTDLELDSIDAVDLAIKLQQLTGKRIKPDEFKTVRTVEDVVKAVESLLAENV